MNLSTRLQQLAHRIYTLNLQLIPSCVTLECCALVTSCTEWPGRLFSHRTNLWTPRKESFEPFSSLTLCLCNQPSNHRSDSRRSYLVHNDLSHCFQWRILSWISHDPFLNFSKNVVSYYSLIIYAFIGTCNRYFIYISNWHTRQASNLQPSVLETGALPIELRIYK